MHIYNCNKIHWSGLRKLILGGGLAEKARDQRLMLILLSLLMILVAVVVSLLCIKTEYSAGISNV